MSTGPRRRRLRVASPSRVDGNALLRQWCAAVKGRVLSIGSGADRDHQGGRYRDYFTAAETYRTSDVRPGCDMVLDVRDLVLSDGVADGIFCHSVLEHVDDPFAAAREIGRVLAPGGVAILGVPFSYRLHRAPHDYWRFTEFGIRELLARHAGLVVEEVVGIDGPANHASMYWARARKP